MRVINFVSSKVSTLINSLDEDEPDYAEDPIDDDPLDEEEYPYEEGEGEYDEPPHEEDDPEKTVDPNGDDGSDPTSENASKDPPKNANGAAAVATENLKDTSSGQQTDFQNTIKDAAGILQTLKGANPNPNPSNDSISTTPDQSMSAPPPQGGQQPPPPPQTQQQQLPPMGPGMGPTPMGIPQQPQQPPPMGIPPPQPLQEQLSGPGKNPTQMGFPPPQAQPRQRSDPRMAPSTNPVSLGLVPCKQVQTGSETVNAWVNIQNEQALSQSQSGSDMAIPTPEQDAIHLHDAFKGTYKHTYIVN